MRHPLGFALAVVNFLMIPFAAGVWMGAITADTPLQRLDVVLR
jgi:hypothetical protein